MAAGRPVGRGAGATLDGVGERDDDREVNIDDELTILPDQTRDDTDSGWGEAPSDNDERLLADRPPHWG